MGSHLAPQPPPSSSWLVPRRSVGTERYRGLLFPAEARPGPVRGPSPSPPSHPGKWGTTGRHGCPGSGRPSRADTSHPWYSGTPNTVLSGQSQRSLVGPPEEPRHPPRLHPTSRHCPRPVRGSLPGHRPSGDHAGGAPEVPGDLGRQPPAPRAPGHRCPEGHCQQGSWKRGSPASRKEGLLHRRPPGREWALPSSEPTHRPPRSSRRQGQTAP